MLKKERWMVPLLTVAFLFLMTSVVDAHVTVDPSESTTNAYEKYTVRVPVEKDINTTEVTLEIPEDVDFVSILPMAEWDYELERGEDEQITSVTWSASDEGIAPNEFIEFAFIGANPSESGEVSWKALQTYEDDSVVEWVGPPDSEEPASVTTIEEGDAVAPHGDSDETSSSETEQEDVQQTSESGSANWVPILLSAVAVLLALISLFRKRT
ncbi:YcnI family protein [Virgibacillus sp. NKC19-3]|uniref:YcnI family copper-binding membrane protein n=1 Tax=Virgibacillus saliphilus TaxID=2831674 RepID=UPI001C9BA92A|nr:YcnI family protein [Virgibacillus sp. NKC19-3]MBY7145064.1 YcnI family protein [Virgibacillus sp. NKC19-3]